MKTLFKKIITIIFSSALILVGFVNIKAEDKEFDHLYDEISREKVTLSEGVDWTKIIANTKTTRPKGNVAGYGSNGPIDSNLWYGQQVNLIEVPRLTTDTGEQKFEVVVWSIQGDQQWDFAGVTRMAADFESKNPDYMVLGGINGDFYDWHTTKDYPNSGNGTEVSNGEVLRTVFTDWGLLGIQNSQANDQLVFTRPSTTEHISSTFFLDVYDENDEIIETIELSGVNMSSLADGETSAYFGSLERVYMYQTTIDENGNEQFVLDSNGNKIPMLNSYGEHAIRERIYHKPTLADGTSYIVVDGDKVIYQAYENSYYGKGTITNVNDGSDVIENSFGIVTKDEHVKELLNSGVKIRVQRHLIGNFENIENAIGCFGSLVDNAAFTAYYPDEYLSTRAPRTIIGAKADGTICLLTMDGRQADKNFYGTNQEEINAILEELEITEAYLLDGGGSSTFFIRENGKFVVKNSPSDGNQRSVSNGILVVTKRDNSIKANNININTNSVEIDFAYEREDITKAYVKLEDEMIEIVEGKVVLDNLSSNTSYTASLYYQVGDGGLVPTTSLLEFTTDKVKPIVKLGNCTVDDDYFYPVLDINDPDGAITIIFCQIGKKKVVYNANPEEGDEPNKVARPAGGTDFVCDITISYQTDKNEYMELIQLQYSYESIKHNHLPCPNCGLCTSPDCDGTNVEKCQGHESVGGETEDSKGCNFGAYALSMVASLGLVLLVLKKRK